MLGYISALMLIMIRHISLKLIGIAQTIDLHKLSCRNNCEASSVSIAGISRIYTVLFKSCGQFTEDIILCIFQIENRHFLKFQRKRGTNKS